MDENNRRRFLRIPFDSTAEIIKDENVYLEEVLDLSAAGFGTDYIEGLNMGDVVDVHIVFEIGEINSKAKVQWLQEGKGIGYRFIDEE